MRTVPDTTVATGDADVSNVGRTVARAAAAVERVLVWPVTVAGCLLLLAITLLLLAGVVSRFIFDAPITWMDELVSILFLWLAVIGATLAFQRLEHMRMTAFIARMSPRSQRLAAAISLLACLGLLAALLVPAIDYAADEAFMTTPNLDLPGSWRAAALPVGIGLMLAFSVLQLARLRLGRELAGAAAICVAVAGGFYLAAPLLAAIGNYRLLVFFVGLVGGVYRDRCADRVQLRHRDVHIPGRHHVDPAERRCQPASTKACRTSCCWPCRCSCSSAP